MWKLFFANGFPLCPEDDLADLNDAPREARVRSMLRDLLHSQTERARCGDCLKNQHKM